MTDVGLFEAIYSARALRRLKPDPVPEAVITQIDAAIRAPSAGNAQTGNSWSSATRSSAASSERSTARPPTSPPPSTRRARVPNTSRTNSGNR